MTEEDVRRIVREEIQAERAKIAAIAQEIIDTGEAEGYRIHNAWQRFAARLRGEEPQD